MIHTFHPEAVAEYAEHVAFYKSLRAELGIRFHEAVKMNRCLVSRLRFIAPRPPGYIRIQIPSVKLD